MDLTGTSVSVDYELADEVLDVNDVRGGLNVFVEDERVVRYRDEDTITWQHSWKPEYAGEYLHDLVTDLVDRSHQLASGNLSCFEEAVVPFSPTIGRLVLQPVTPSELRVAHRISDGSADVPSLPTAESARGYLVDRCEFCRAVSDAAHDYLREVREFPLEWGEILLEELEEDLVDLDEALETCEETQPSISCQQ